MRQITEAMQLLVLSVLLLAGASFGDVARVPGETISDIVTDGSLEKSLDKDVCMHNCEMNEIPLELAEEINEVTDINVYLNNFVEAPEGSSNSSYRTSKRSRRALDRSNRGLIPRAAGCSVIPTVVSLRPPNDKDPTIVYGPPCTRVNRCSGCCTHKLLSCQPTEQNDIVYTIYKSQYIGSTKLKNLGQVQVTVPEHTKCQCLCTIKESDCIPNLQSYDRSQCKCLCTNTADQEKCLTENSIKLWDSTSCSCVCREPKDCTTGSYFDPNSCSCVKREDYDQDYHGDMSNLEEEPLDIHSDSKNTNQATSNTKYQIADESAGGT